MQAANGEPGKAINQLITPSLMCTAGEISCIEIARLTGYSQIVVTNTTAKLLDEGLMNFLGFTKKLNWIPG